MFGMFKAFFRFVGNIFRRGERRVNEAADNVFTRSVGGISDAYDDAQDSLVKTYKGLEAAVSQVEMILEEKKDKLARLNEKEKDRLELREGALSKFEKAAPGSEEQQKYEKLFAELDAEINQIEAEQATLEASIKGSQESMKGYLSKLKDLKAELQKLPEEKAEQIATFVSDSKLIELNDRLQGLETSFDRGPLQAVRAANAKLSAQARVSQKMAGADKKADYDELREAARSTSAKDRMQQMLAARKAEKGAMTGDQKVAAKEERKEL